jgi:hypothetical protein
MKTQISLTTGQEKAIALKQYFNEDYFILETDEGAKIYEGTEQEAASTHVHELAANEGQSFSEWCNDNLTEIEEYDDNNYDNDYLILTDEEADEKASEYILDSVWAFTPSFLSSFTGFDIEIFESIQNNGRCESNNSAILTLIEDKEDFVSDAISADGRGHFLSSYDGNENEEKVNETTYFIYRQN